VLKFILSLIDTRSFIILTLTLTLT